MATLHRNINKLPKVTLWKKYQQLYPVKSWCRNTSGGWSSDDYQLLDRSKVPMLHFQPSLPRLPIPKLEKTCERYLASQKPLLTDSQFETTEKHVRQFQKEQGSDLQQQLVSMDKRNKHTSYITDMWFEMYLQSRDPLPIIFNPFLGLVNDPKKDYNDQLVRTTNILISSLRFMKSLKIKSIEPEVYHLNPAKSDNERFRQIVRLVPSRFSWYAAFLMKAFPLDMSQYVGLFNATRIPKQGKDVIQRDPDSKHMLILRGGHMYVFDVLDSNGLIKEPAYIHACIAKVLSEQRAPCDYPVAALTTLNRDTWAKIRDKLLANGNQDTLKLVDSAIFSLSLEDVESKEDPFIMVPRLLHGDGSNLWFDKSLQVIVMKDGKAGINFEHSWGDGVAVMRFVNELFKDSTERPRIHPQSSPLSIDENTVRHLEFNLNPELKNDIKTAMDEYRTTTAKLQFNFNMKKGYGKHFLKKQQLSPDSVMQLSFQIAYLKYKAKTVASYESCSTAAFLHGRTEVIRPATSATKQCAEAFLQSNRPSNAELKHMMNTCSQIHGQLTKEAATGQGFDRHLFALKYLSEKAKQPLAAIFKDPAYSSINHNIISTSTLSSPACEVGAFGPVVPEGLGIGYLVEDDGLGAVVSNYKAHSDGNQYSQCLLETWDDIYKILQH